MKIIDQSYEIIKKVGEDIAPSKMIELAGRTCYKSEDKITEDSADKFCKMLIDRGHEAMIEHANIIVSVDRYTYEDIYKSKNTQYLHFSDKKRFLISGNARVWRDFFKATALSENMYFDSIIGAMKNYASVLFNDIIYFNETFSECDYINIVPENELDKNEIKIHGTMSVRFITDRGISHEIVRHRPASYAQESTRYVNYKDKNMEFILPVFSWSKRRSEENKSASYIRNAFINCCTEAEDSYGVMIRSGASPQEARTVLPNCLKTEIVVTANVVEWKHIFDLRTAKAAHPQIRELMKPLCNEVSSDF